MAKPISRGEAYSRITITIPTFAVLMLRRFAKRRSEKQDGGAETISTVLESWILALLNEREIAKAAKESPEFKRAALAWMRWEEQQRARRKPDLRARRVKP